MFILCNRIPGIVRTAPSGMHGFNFVPHEKSLEFVAYKELSPMFVQDFLCVLVGIIQTVRPQLEGVFMVGRFCAPAATHASHVHA